MGWYVGGLIEAVMDVLLYDAGLSDCLAPQEDDLDLGLASHRADRVVHLLIIEFIYAYGANKYLCCGSFVG
jgi:hypothetical protein